MRNRILRRGLWYPWILENFEKMIISRKIKKYENFKYLKDEWKKYGMIRHSTSPPCGNLVDGLPHDCHNTKTVAKPDRLGPAQNGKLMPKNIELSMFCSMTCKKTQRKLCQAYIEHWFGCDKMSEIQCQREIDGFQISRNFEKMIIFRKNQKKWKFESLRR